MLKYCSQVVVKSKRCAYTLGIKVLRRIFEMQKEHEKVLIVQIEKLMRDVYYPFSASVWLDA